MAPAVAPVPVEAALRFALAREGPRLLEYPDALRLELETRCPDDASDVALLIAALDEQLPQALLNVRQDDDPGRLIARLERRLVERRHLDACASGRAVRLWSTVLEATATTVASQTGPGDARHGVDCDADRDFDRELDHYRQRVPKRGRRPRALPATADREAVSATTITGEAEPPAVPAAILDRGKDRSVGRRLRIGASVTVVALAVVGIRLLMVASPRVPSSVDEPQRDATRGPASSTASSTKTPTTTSTVSPPAPVATPGPDLERTSPPSFGPLASASPPAAAATDATSPPQPPSTPSAASSPPSPSLPFAAAPTTDSDLGPTAPPAPERAQDRSIARRESRGPIRTAGASGEVRGVPKTNAETACGPASCGSVVMVRDAGRSADEARYAAQVGDALGLTQSDARQTTGLRRFDVTIRMDDRTIRSMSQTREWHSGARVQLVGGRLIALPVARPVVRRPADTDDSTPRAVTPRP